MSVALDILHDSLPRLDVVVRECDECWPRRSRSVLWVRCTARRRGCEGCNADYPAHPVCREHAQGRDIVGVGYKRMERTQHD